MKVWLLIAALFAASAKASACSAIDNHVAQDLEMLASSPFRQDGGISNVDFDAVSKVCKSWPQRQGRVILAMPYTYSQASGYGDDLTYLGIIVAVIDEGAGTVLSRVNETKVMAVDALRPDEVSIDTANYKLAEYDLAFGIRISRRNYVSITQIQEEIMVLYLPEAGTLKNVANALLVASYHGEGDGRCKFSGSESNTVVVVGNSKTNGFFDLVARTRTAPITYSGDETSCIKTTENPVEERNVLKYDGKHFLIPRPLQASID